MAPFNSRLVIFKKSSHFKYKKPGLTNCYEPFRVEVRGLGQNVSVCSSPMGLEGVWEKERTCKRMSLHCSEKGSQRSQCSAQHRTVSYFMLPSISSEGSGRGVMVASQAVWVLVGCRHLLCLPSNCISESLFPISWFSPNMGLDAGVRKQKAQMYQIQRTSLLPCHKLL